MTVRTMMLHKGDDSVMFVMDDATGRATLDNSRGEHLALTKRNAQERIDNLRNAGWEPERRIVRLQHGKDRVTFVVDDAAGRAAMHNSKGEHIALTKRNADERIGNLVRAGWTHQARSPHGGERGLTTVQAMGDAACVAGGFVAGVTLNAKYPEGVRIAGMKVRASIPLGVGSVVGGVAVKRLWGWRRTGRALIAGGIGSGLASLGAKKGTTP